ncbi:MAG: 50S ribosomal protein L21 [Candidatus Dormibacteraeota bacterium]|nr:50S ribosomal protein L21 [Candidatus Dormibacteraeota bacterium]
MYAILKHGGHQYRVVPGDRLLVDRLTAEVGSRVTLEPVLLVADGDAIADIGAGAVSGAHVLATVVAHRRGRKLRVFTYKPKKRHRRTLGYRSQLTELLVEEVAPGGDKPAARRDEKPAAKAAAAEAATAPAEPKRRARPAPAAEPAPTAPEPEAAAEAEPDAVGEVLEAAPEAKPGKRAARPRKKADGT